MSSMDRDILASNRKVTLIHPLDRRVCALMTAVELRAPGIAMPASRPLI